MCKSTLVALGFLLTVPVLGQKTSPDPAVPHFEDMAAQAGLSVAHISSPEKRYIVESMSGGVGLIDCDNDGKLDILTVNGSTVDRYRENGGDLMITLYTRMPASNSRTSPSRQA